MENQYCPHTVQNVTLFVFMHNEHLLNNEKLRGIFRSEE